MSDYDRLAADYDQHFTRPVDAWEDERLARALGALVRGRRVIDLGCGTGWLLDHCEPGTYTGVDASAPMLARLMEKHPDVEVVKATVGTAGWVDEVMAGARSPANVVTATWAAHEFLPLTRVLFGIRRLLEPGGLVLLHGQAPRYRRRRHYILDGNDDRQGFRQWTPDRCESAGTVAGLTWAGATGTGATPDVLAQSHRLWHAGLRVPPRWHYAFLAAWRLP